MSLDVLRRVFPADARGMSKSLLATVAGVSTPTVPNPSTLSKHVALAMPDLVAAAQTATANLLTAATRRDVARKERSRLIDQATLAEKRTDRQVGALSLLLDSLIGGGTEGAVELKEYLLPEGSVPVTELTGRPQVGFYDEWKAGFAKRPAQGTPADQQVAPKLAEIEALITAFGAALDAKDVASRLADEAIGQLAVARVEWANAIAELREGVQLVNKAVPARAEAWWTPVLEWQRAQEARASRGEPEIDADLPPEPGEEAPAAEIPTPSA